MAKKRSETFNCLESDICTNLLDSYSSLDYHMPEERYVIYLKYRNKIITRIQRVCLSQAQPPARVWTIITINQQPPTCPYWAFTLHGSQIQWHTKINQIEYSLVVKKEGKMLILWCLWGSLKGICNHNISIWKHWTKNQYFPWHLWNEIQDWRRREVPLKLTAWLVRCTVYISVWQVWLPRTISGKLIKTWK